jgi:MYXO-CTERM domain-containing protein
VGLMWIYASAAASGATLSVPADFATIAGAVAAASSGDVIDIAPGVYDEHVAVAGTTLTLRGGPGVTWTSPVEPEILVCTNFAGCTVVGVRFDGEGQRRAIDVDGNSVLTAEGLTVVGGAATNGGGIRATGAVALVVTDSVFDGNAATSSGGHIYATGTPLVQVSASQLTAGTAVVDGGAIRVSNGDLVVLSDLWVEGNDAGDDGGGIDVDATLAFELRRSMICDNVAVDEGGGVVVRDAIAAVQGNILVGNVARAGGGLMGANNDLETTNNHFVGNEAADNGSGAYATGTYASVNDLFVHHVTRFALDDAGAAVSYGGFWGNGAGDSNAALPGNVVTADPLLGGAPPFACDLGALQPQPGSPLFDAGDPGISDPDGTRSDIGAFGGDDPFPTTPADEDNDGFDALSDCDDTDPDRYPGAPERCNGLDDDCDDVLPADEGDGDGDGWLACAECDDDLPAVNPSQGEVPCNGLDDDCDVASVDDGDEDADGVTICAGDCDDTDAGIPSAEAAGDGVDQDCDGSEVCYPDTDGDGRGEPGAVPSDDIDCSDPGEAAGADDVCIGFDDRVDPDGDGVPTGCDPCPDDAPDDSDGDGLCGSLDDDDVPEPADGDGDADGDGAMDAADPLPGDPGGRSGPAPLADLGCGCAATGAPGSSGPLVLALAALAGLRRRGRSRAPRLRGAPPAPGRRPPGSPAAGRPSAAGRT